MIARRISPAFLCGMNMRADMKTVYFVRHGSTESNEQGAYQHASTPLSELEGAKQHLWHVASSGSLWIS
jgi:hypothetical protein